MGGPPIGGHRLKQLCPWKRLPIVRRRAELSGLSIFVCVSLNCALRTRSMSADAGLVPRGFPVCFIHMDFLLRLVATLLLLPEIKARIIWAMYNSSSVRMTRTVTLLLLPVIIGALDRL